MYWLLAAFLIGLLGWFWVRFISPTPAELTDPTTLAKLLRFVVMRGALKKSVHGEVIVYRRESKHPRLLFRKVRATEGQFGLQAFLDRGQYESYVGPFRQVLDRPGVNHSPTSALNESGVAIEIGRDYGLALMVTRAFFEDTVGASLSRDCLATMRAVLWSNATSLTGTEVSDEEAYK
jgi:hypothetical protein